MSWQCCTAGRLSATAASVLPGVALVLLPKCPLCLAAWLTVATGVGFSAAGAAWLHRVVVLYLVAVLMLFIARMIRRLTPHRRYWQRLL